MIHSIVGKYEKNQYSDLYQDLYSEGVLALTECARRFKQDKAKFSTYAYIRIRGAILNFLQANKSLIRIPWQAKQENFTFTGETELEYVHDSESFYEQIELNEALKVQMNSRQYSVFTYKCKGFTQAEISEKMKLSLGTVNRIISQIKEIILNSL